MVRMRVRVIWSGSKQPIRGCRVQLVFDSATKNTAELQTDANGIATFHTVATGNADIIVDGMFRVRTFFDDDSLVQVVI